MDSNQRKQGQVSFLILAWNFLKSARVFIIIIFSVITSVIYLNDYTKSHPTVTFIVSVIIICLLSITVLILYYKVVNSKAKSSILISKEHDNEVIKFYELLENCNSTVECMAFNLNDHSAAEHCGVLIKKIEEGVKFRYLLFDITTLTPEMAYKELKDGNTNDPGRPYTELITCITNFQDIYKELKARDRLNMEIRFVNTPNTMRYYSFDIGKNGVTIIAPYFTQTYRVNAKFLTITKAHKEQQMYYNNAFKKVWDNSPAFSFDKADTMKRKIGKAKENYLSYINTQTQKL